MTSTKSVTPRTPARERGRETRERLLAAAETLLRTRRLEDLTIREIVREAGASVGSFYHFFGSRDGIVGPLYERYDERVTRGAARVLDPERWRGRSLTYRAGRVVRYAVYLYRRESGLIRALVLYARSAERPVSDAQSGRRHVLYEKLAALLLERREEIAHPDPTTAVRLGIFFVGAACRDRILFDHAPHPESVALDDRSLAHELTRALLGYLTIPTTGVDA